MAGAWPSRAGGRNSRDFVSSNALCGRVPRERADNRSDADFSRCAGPALNVRRRRSSCVGRVGLFRCKHPARPRPPIPRIWPPCGSFSPKGLLCNTLDRGEPQATTSDEVLTSLLWKVMPMGRFKFLHPEWREIEPSAWLTRWAARYGDGDNPVYFVLIAKQGRLSSDDFEQVGRWKEGCLKPSNGRWKTGTPTGYDIWMQARAQAPKCPEQSELPGFLKDWKERTFVAGKKGDLILRHRFGLSRATTLLHFISGGRYPIFDARVATALIRLGSPTEETIDGYLIFCPLFSEIAAVCGVSGIEAVSYTHLTIRAGSSLST